jgi:hypothetical protein
MSGTISDASSNIVTSDASAVGSNKAINKSDYANYFMSIISGNEDFHLKNSSAVLWGVSNVGAIARAETNNSIFGQLGKFLASVFSSQ